MEVSACSLIKDPLTYHHKLVRVSSRISFGFEDFTLAAGECHSKEKHDAVWLEFGGDVDSQTVYCCGDHSRPKNVDIQLDGYSLPLRRDIHLEEFLRLLKAERLTTPSGGPCYDCFYFHVSATVTGRFFAGGWTLQKSGSDSSHVGYGHLGCCSLLVIAGVSEVSAERTPIPAESHYSCQKRMWRRPLNSAATDSALAQKTEMSDEKWRFEDFHRVATETIQRLAAEWGGGVPTTTPVVILDVSRRIPRARGTWASEDYLLTYAIEVRKLEELAPKTKGPARQIWVSFTVSQEVCAPARIRIP